MPSNLGVVYTYILREVVDPDDRPQALLIMQWIFLAQRPLSVIELRLGMAIDDSSIQSTVHSGESSENVVEDDLRMVKLIASLSGGLAEVKAFEKVPYYSEAWEKSHVQFIHESVTDILYRDRFRCLDPTSNQDLIGLGHDRLSRLCLNYLQQENLLSQAENSKTARPRYSISVVLKEDFLFVGYATISWYRHAEKAEELGVT